MPSAPQSELQEMLLKCRTERDLTLVQMAKQLRLSPAGLSKIERGKVKPNRTTEARIVTFLRKHGYFLKAAEAA